MKEPMKSTTIRISEKDLMEVKKIAIDNNTSVSEIVREYIRSIVEKGSLE